MRTQKQQQIQHHRLECMQLHTVIDHRDQKQDQNKKLKLPEHILKFLPEGYKNLGTQYLLSFHNQQPYLGMERLLWHLHSNLQHNRYHHHLDLLLLSSTQRRNTQLKDMNPNLCDNLTMDQHTLLRALNKFKTSSIFLFN